MIWLLVCQLAVAQLCGNNCRHSQEIPDTTPEERPAGRVERLKKELRKAELDVIAERINAHKKVRK